MTFWHYPYNTLFHFVWMLPFILFQDRVSGPWAHLELLILLPLCLNAGLMGVCQHAQLSTTCLPGTEMVLTNVSCLCSKICSTSNELAPVRGEQVQKPTPRQDAAKDDIFSIPFPHNTLPVYINKCKHVFVNVVHLLVLNVSCLGFSTQTVILSV